MALLLHNKPHLKAIAFEKCTIELGIYGDNTAVLQDCFSLNRSTAAGLDEDMNLL